MNEGIDASQLRALSPLDELKELNFDALLQEITPRKAKRGQTLFKQGDNLKQTVYVLSGTVQLRNGCEEGPTIIGGSSDARLPLAPQLPRPLSAVAINDVQYISVDSELLDRTMTWDQTGIYEVADITADVLEQGNDWMSALLRIKAFQSIPAANIQTLFMSMQQVNFKAGDVVVRQKTEGDYFYVISEGRCSVTRETDLRQNGVLLNELEAGDTFGEEALITDAKRSATVTMLTDGTLMRLSKKDFHELLREPAVEWVDYTKANEILANGGKLLDVRLPSEFKARHVDGSLNLPLFLLRLKLDLLDRAARYVLCCDTGIRSSAAAFVLNTKDFDAVVLKGGLNGT